MQKEIDCVDKKVEIFVTLSVDDCVVVRSGVGVPKDLTTFDELYIASQTENPLQCSSYTSAVGASKLSG